MTVEFYSSVYDAIQNGDAESLAQALEEGADPDKRNEAGLSLSTLCCIWDRPEMLRKLMSCGADIEPRRGRVKESPFVKACASGSAECLGILLGLQGALQWIADPEIAGEAAGWAASNGHHEVLRMLFESGLDPAFTCSTISLIEIARIERHEQCQRMIESWMDAKDARRQLDEHTPKPARSLRPAGL